MLLFMHSILSFSLLTVIKNILNYFRFRERSLEVSRILKDRPMSAIDTAVWWTEYVLRHDTTHLKPLNLGQSWIERRLLDVFAFLLLIICIFSYISVKLFFLFFKCICNSKNSRNSINSADEKKKI
jgi:glucuronosyltransferase